MTSILAFNPSHDGAAVLIEDKRLISVMEAEKNSNERHSRLSVAQFLECGRRLGAIPDVLAIGGWSNYFGGYSGLDCPRIQKTRLFGSEVALFSSSHERSHLVGTFAMSPFEERSPCYCLLWEGTIGSFYRIDEEFKIHRVKDVLSHPGWRYSYAYYLGLKNHETPGFWGRMEMAGKLMALAGISTSEPLLSPEVELIDWILNPNHPIQRDSSIPSYLPSNKRNLPVSSEVVNSGVESDRFRNFAWHFSNALFDIFFQVAKTHLKERIPLLISGGCGLNCDWNSKWKNAGLFPDVFVSPCANDSGSAIGTAADAQFALTGSAKINWNVYAGHEFQNDSDTPDDWRELPLDLDTVCSQLLRGDLIPWVQDRCELGPRALGNRSIFAEPYSRSTTVKLNNLKMRENYRPIAPICLEEDVSLHFDWSGSSPYMLYFQRVTDGSLKAVTHTDGTARVQTVNANENAKVHRLLKSFKAISGKGVLCNTSLNFKHRGFINRRSDLLRFAEDNCISTFVVNDSMFCRNNGP